MTYSDRIFIKEKCPKSLKPDLIFSSKYLENGLSDRGQKHIKMTLSSSLTSWELKKTEKRFFEFSSEYILNENLSQAKTFLKNQYLSIKKSTYKDIKSDSGDFDDFD